MTGQVLRRGGLAATVLGCAAAAALGAQQIGALSLHGAGVVGLSPETGVHTGARFDISFVVGAFSLGPELGLYFTGPASLGAHPGRGENVFTYGAVARRWIRAGSWRPFVVAGLGRYTWESSREDAPTGEYFSGSVGLGMLRALTTSGTGLSAELRFHQLLQNTGVQGTRQFVTLTAGASFGW